MLKQAIFPVVEVQKGVVGLVLHTTMCTLHILKLLCLSPTVSRYQQPVNYGQSF